MLKRGSGRQTEVKKKEKQVEFAHDELIGQGIGHKVGLQTKAAASALKVKVSYVIFLFLP